MPLLEHELVLDPFRVIREYSFVETIPDSLPNLDQERRSRSSGNIGVRGRPVQQQFGRTGRIRDSKHQRCQSQISLGIRVRTFLQQELNKVEVAHDAPVAGIVQRCFISMGRYSVDVGAVFNQLFGWFLWVE
jgi:hypothetical protein